MTQNRLNLSNQLRLFRQKGAASVWNEREHVVGIEQKLAATVHGEESRDRVAAIEQLTPTQRKVLRGVHLGLLNKQIAHDLGIAEATVKAHMTALMRKLNVHNRTQAAMAAQTLGGEQGNGASLTH